MGREGVTKRVAGRALRDPGLGDGSPKRTLHDALVKMMALASPVGRHVHSARREQILPAPVDLDAGELAAQTVLDAGRADAGAPVPRRAQGRLSQLRSH